MASVLYTGCVCVCVCVLLSLKTGCINMNPPLDFIGSIRGMRLWASEIALVREAERERESGREGERGGSRDMAEGQGR